MTIVVTDTKTYPSRQDARKTKKGGNNNILTLEEEATLIQPIIEYCVNLYHNGHLSPSDLTGSYILLYLGIRRKAWSGGRLKTPINTSLTTSESTTAQISPPPPCTPHSINIFSVPGLAEILDGDYVLKKMGKGQKHKQVPTSTPTLPQFVQSIQEDSPSVTVTVLSIFNELQLCGIKKNSNDYVNR